jgi:hypothetical protein
VEGRWGRKEGRKEDEEGVKMMKEGSKEDEKGRVEGR